MIHHEENANVGLRLTHQASLWPEQLGIATPTGSHRQGTARRYHTISLRDLDLRSSSIAAGMQAMGIGPGKRIALLVRFGEDFIALVFALLKCGANLILIDPGMGKKNLLHCLAQSSPDGLVAIPLAHAIVWAKRSMFPNARLNVTVGRRYGILPQPTLRELERQRPADFRPVRSSPSDSAAIIFTTGSTGPPKGVQYSHQTFNAQIDKISRFYGIEPGGLDLSGFPLFGLFNAVMGTGTILPDMDPTRPADVDPVRLLDAIDQWQVNQSFGSPALWTRVGGYCVRTGRRAESLRMVLSAGAPVSPRILEQVRSSIHPDGAMHTPYGATEALPIASIESRQVLGETAARTRSGAGTCVGERFPGIRWRVIEISDRPIDRLEQARELPAGEIGELLVAGSVVTQAYVTHTEQNALHKVLDESLPEDCGRYWHRMGDVGYLDERDRFWFCGRKGHRVTTPRGVLFTEPIEAILNTDPRVERSALVPLGKAPHQVPLVLVEPSAGQCAFLRRNLPGVAEEWEALLRSKLPGTEVRRFAVYPRRLPTDIRHNSKIFREILAEWAAKHLAGGS